ncbi:Golgin subfamily A member 5 [Chionoecetes opilio]|uniref:Golgin subfamily A member 5 n=1 Tax=Chionoecetes opilio TaxID=41210 RepID=A0A8J4YIP1_CHIOP|nr:Golgin subfamily A member 5 [Chionoecetes opilio]
MNGFIAVSGQLCVVMSWITDLAGRAENLLNKLDTEAATALTKTSERRNSATTKTRALDDAATTTFYTTKHERSVLPSSSSVPNNLSSYGVSSSAAKTQFSPKTKKISTKKRDSAKEEGLMDYLNSPSQQDADQLPSSALPADPMVSSTTMTASSFSSLGHSRHSSMSSASSLVALSGRDTPGSANNDNESGSCGSANTDAYITVDPPSDINISAPPSTDGSTSSNGAMTGSGDSENSLLRKEVASLNQEMSQVLRRAKDSERETQQLRNQVSGMLSQQSTGDRLMRDLHQREIDLQVVDQSDCGASVGNTKITDLVFADDAVIFAESLEVLVMALEALHEEAKPLGLEVSWLKTKVQESLRAKDSQLAVLRVRLQEADDKVQGKDGTLAELQAENRRLIEGASESSGLHSHALQSLQDRLGQTQSVVDRQQHHHNAAHMELTQRVSQLEEERHSLAATLAEGQRRLEEEKQRNQHVSQQMNSLRGELSSCREELREYKAKASRILQSKEKLIASLKEDRGGGGETSSSNWELHLAELQQTKAERDLLREELEGTGARVQQLILEVSEAESAAQDQAALAAHNAANLEETLTHERRRRGDVEAELRQIQEELRCAHEELTRQKLNFSSRLQERDTEIDRLRKQVAHKQSSSSSVSELEQRVHDLTESLIHKQTNIETLSTEKHSLLIQMERLQQQYDESQKMLNRDPPTLFRQDDVRNRVPSFLVESPFDGGMTRHVKRAYSTLDKFSVRLGVFLRRYPIARVFVIVYMCLLHLWVMVVLLTYTPEVHGADYHHPAGTMPHDQ